MTPTTSKQRCQGIKKKPVVLVSNRSSREPVQPPSIDPLKTLFKKPYREPVASPKLHLTVSHGNRLACVLSRACPFVLKSLEIIGVVECHSKEIYIAAGD